MKKVVLVVTRENRAFRGNQRRYRMSGNLEKTSLFLSLGETSPIAHLNPFLDLEERCEP